MFSAKSYQYCIFLLCFRVFFYNPTTKTSVWEKPAEMVGRNDVAKMLESSQVPVPNRTHHLLDPFQNLRGKSGSVMISDSFADPNPIELASFFRIRPF
jgi:hypothetical protein